MASDGIFLISGSLDGGEAQLFEMTEQPYDSEDVLQTLLERYPNLLAGGQIDPENPRRWLLIKREQEVADAADGSGRWSLDHLFVDQDGVPTLVEVKRATDTRIRREVVGQMFDYAANGVAYWPIERIRADFEARHPDPDEFIGTALGIDAVGLWEKVGENLASGNVRLLFVADEIPRELKRIVEFMNEQMKAEVLAIAVKQHGAVGVEARTMTATVYGATERGRAQRISVARPSWARSPAWEEGRFFDALAPKGAAAVSVATRLLHWASSSPRLKIDWGRGATLGTFHVYVTLASRSPVMVQTDGRIYVNFGRLSQETVFAPAAARRELAARLEQIPGISFDGKTDNHYPSFALEALQSNDSFELFTDAIESAAGMIRAQREI